MRRSNAINTEAGKVPASCRGLGMREHPEACETGNT